MPNPKKILIKKLPKFETDLYANLSYGDLVVFALSYLEEKGIDASAEEIVSICFRLFPQKFGLKSYPRWPDSALVIRRINDEREKKNIKGNPAEGFVLTFKGKGIAKRVPTQLGIKKKDVKKKKKTKPAPLVLTKKTLRKRFRKPIQSKPVKKKVFKNQTKKTNKVVSPKLKKKIVVKSIPVKGTKATKPKPASPKVKSVGHASNVTKNVKTKSGGLQTRPTKVPIKKKVEVKNESTTKLNKKIVVKLKSKPKQLVMTPVPVKKKVEVKKEAPAKPSKTVFVKEKSKPKQLTLSFATPNVGHAFSVTNNKAKSGGLQTRPTKAPVKKKVAAKKQVETKKETQKVVKVEPVVNISKEEKMKAGKVIYQVEKSDAYKSYQKNGKQAKISEFDFRNMLFATMESSPDTLTRNVALFKKYANIQSRNDVITFLVFCEENFAKLLKKR